VNGLYTAPATIDEHELIACAQQGDRQAFHELVCRYHESVVRVVYRMCGDPRLAEDAAQEAFVRVWLNLHKYKPEYAFRSWLFRIATNAALDALRREKPSSDIDQLPLADQAEGPERSAEGSQRIEQVRRAIAGLSEPLRVVIVLREYEDLSYQEIADTLDIPIGTVMSRLNNARIQLRRELTGILEEA
jgi:RNA polymerase sigma-70 factor (ECF subfamily)